MTALQHVRTHLVRGLLLLLPAIITVWLLGILFGVVSTNVTPWVLGALRALGVEGIEGWRARIVVPLIGVLLTLLFIYLVGLLASNLIGRRFLDWVEGVILKVPFVKGIYGGSRQILDAFSPGRVGSFSRVVLVEYPRRGVWTLGFVTTEETVEMPAAPSSVPSVMVFLPTTPNPTSGWLAIVPVADLVEMNITIEEGVKLVVSGGIVTPERLTSRIRRPATSEGAGALRR